MGGAGDSQLGAWLTATMRSRDLSQAELARTLGVADAQVSRWRRGQVVPSVRHLQRLADALAVPRADLDRLAGHRVSGPSGLAPEVLDPSAEAELQAYQARFRRALERDIPRELWSAYAAACEALAAGLVGAYAGALDDAVGTGAAGPRSPGAAEIGFPTGSGRHPDDPEPAARDRAGRTGADRTPGRRTR